MLLFVLQTRAVFWELFFFVMHASYSWCCLASYRRHCWCFLFRFTPAGIGLVWMRETVLAVLYGLDCIPHSILVMFEDCHVEPILLLVPGKKARNGEERHHRFPTYKYHAYTCVLCTIGQIFKWAWKKFSLVAHLNKENERGAWFFTAFCLHTNAQGTRPAGMFHFFLF